MEVRRAVQDQFGAAAADYASSAVHALGADLAELVGHAKLRGDERVLDVGCGAGHTAFAFAPHVAAVEGLDLTEAMLDQARRLAGERELANVSFRLGDVEALPHADRSFDIVTSRQCAHHFPHLERALAEIARVLVPGGTFLVVDSVAPEKPSQDRFINELEVLRDPSHVRDHTCSQWRQMLYAAGFESELLDTWSIELDFADWVKRMRTPPAAVAQLRALMDGASDDQRSAFSIREGGFSLPAALLRGRLSPS